jgi:serine/threonine-protein kinase RsbW
MRADPEYLCVARAVVRQVLRIAGLSEDEYELVTLGVEEALTNVIRHGYGGPCNEPIIIKINRIDHYDENGAALEVVIRDFGRQVDPRSIKARNPEEPRPGGRGVYIMKSVMDEVEFSRADDRGMELRMVRRIK